MNNGTNNIPNPAVNPFVGKLLHVQQTAADGNAGGTATQGSWETRPLTDIVTNEVGAKLSSNVMTLPAGDYFCLASAAYVHIGVAQLRLRDTILGSNLLLGQTIDTVSGAGASAVIRGKFTLSETTTVELQSQVAATNTGDGFGAAGSFGDGEVYADVLIWKLDQ